MMIKLALGGGQLLIEKPDGRRYRILLYSGRWMVTQYEYETMKDKPPVLLGFYKTLKSAMQSIK
jgi:hypothetical protein